MKIYKYPLELDYIQYIDIPVGYRLLSVQMQGDTPVMWVLVYPDAPKACVKFHTFGTGEDIKEADLGQHVGTYQLDQLVFHVFEEFQFKPLGEFR